MSIGIALVGADGIILASDSRKRYSDGSYNDNAQKIFELTPKVGVIGIGQHAEYQDWLIVKFASKPYRTNVRTQDLPFEDIVDSFLRDIKEDYDYITSKVSRYILSHPMSELTFILAGYNSEGKPCIVALDSSASDYPFAPAYMANPPRGVAGIESIWTYWVNQLEEQNFKLEDLSIKSLKLLVAFIINETAKANKLVGGSPQIAVIQQDKNVKMLNSQEIEQLQSQIANLVNTKRLIAVLSQS